MQNSTTGAKNDGQCRIDLRLLLIGNLGRAWTGADMEELEVSDWLIETGVTTNRVRPVGSRRKRPRKDPVRGGYVQVCISMGRHELAWLDMRRRELKLQLSTFLRRAMVLL